MKNKKAINSFAFMLILMLMFAVTSLALFSQSLVLYNNSFETGGVKIDFNGGNVVFDEKDLLLQPDSGVTKTMTVKNISTGSIYYRIYMENVCGSLASVLEFRVYRNGVLLRSDTASDFGADEALYCDVALSPGETDTYTISAYMPGSSGNAYQNGYITFDLVANAVQSKNNPSLEFD